MKKQALLFLSHLADPVFIDRFRRLKKAFSAFGDAYYMYDESHQKAPSEIQQLQNVTFSLEELSSRFKDREIKRLIPGNAHLPLLKFAEAHPEYDYYWNIEYDVVFTGPWRLFFYAMKSSNADLLGTHFYAREQQPEWWWWSTYSKTFEGNKQPDLIRYFGPIYRISRAAAVVLLKELDRGTTGHHEVMLPTTINEQGLIIEDLAKNGIFPGPRLWNWYVRGGNSSNGHLGASSMRFRPCYSEPGSRRFTLYHPLKG